jgi:phospholipid/cholesterol/gamma-HCH transport system substrate-binding protein
VIEASRRVSVWVGLFVVVVGAVGAAVVLFLGAASRVFTERAHVEVRFEDVTGLRKGAAVQIAGVTVGTVYEVRLAPEGEHGVLVEGSLGQAAFSRLRTDAKATLITIGLLGDRVITLDPGRAAAPLPPGQTLPGRQPTDINDAIAQAQKAAAAIEGLAATATRKLAELDTQRLFGNLLAASLDLRRIIARLEHGHGPLRVLADDRQAAAQLRATISQLADASRAGDAFARHLERSGGHLSEIVDYVHAGRGTLGGIIYDPAIYEDLRTVFGRVRRSLILRALARFIIRRAGQ